MPARTTKAYLAVGSVLTWFAVILQFYLIILNRVQSVPETIIRFFSFYTVLTNILVALCFTTVLLKPASRLGRFFASPGVATAIALYITVVGIIYNMVLRSLWNPAGLQKLVDELLHVFVPLLFLFYWFAFVQKKGVEWKDIVLWLLYPLVYVIVILLRGAVSNFYPYPFIDVSAIGYGDVLVNSCGVLLLFILLSLLFISIAKAIAKRTEG